MDHCALCPNVNACLPPDGPEDADVLFIGEAPGKQENQKGRVFIGKTGDEVNRHYLPLSGLRRDRVLFTNTIACFPNTAGGKLDPKRAKDVALAECCAAHHLYPLIERTRPAFIVPMGAFACRAIGIAGDLEHGHGIPQEIDFGRLERDETKHSGVHLPDSWHLSSLAESGYRPVVFPMYHPALGIYEPKKMLMIRTDWIRLKQLLNGTLHIPYDPYPNPDYREVTDEAEIQELDPTLPLSGDTESTRKREPFCLTLSQRAGTGRLIRATNRHLLRALQKRLSIWEGPILFHNWFYDWTVTEAMDLHFPYHRIVDTMAEVYRLGNLPQGLKALAYRELGMTMHDFPDLVIPYSREHVLNYYRIAQCQEWEKPAEELVQDDKTGLWKLYKPQSMSTKLKRFFTDYSKSPDKDVFLTWDNWESHQAAITEKCGEWPGLCISHVPFEKVLHYACRDADALIRLWPILRHMQRRVRKTGQENWRN